MADPRVGNARQGMRRVGLALGVVLALLMGALGTSADDAPDAPTSDSAPGTLEFVGKNLFATANGSFREWRIVDNGVDVEALEQSFAVVEVTLASVDTGSERRDDHLRSADFFEIETFPKAIVRVHSLRRVGENAMGKSLYSAQFDLDLHGVEKTLEGEIVLLGFEPLVVEGKLTIDRLDFGIGSPPSGWNPMSIKPKIPVRFRLSL